MLKCFFSIGSSRGKIDSGNFGRALHQYFSYYFGPLPPTLKYPLHAPAEKSSYLVNTACETKVFDYDCVTLYDTKIYLICNIL